MENGSVGEREVLVWSFGDCKSLLYVAFLHIAVVLSGVLPSAFAVGSQGGGVRCKFDTDQLNAGVHVSSI